MPTRRKGKPTKKVKTGVTHDHPGQPTKYRPKYCKDVVDFARRTGKPFAYFGVEIGVSRDTLYEWANTHKEFSYAKKRANEEANNFMIGLGLKATQGKIRYFNTGAFAMIMKNCHGWRDNPEPEDEAIDDVTFPDAGEDEDDEG